MTTDSAKHVIFFIYFWQQDLKLRSVKLSLHFASIFVTEASAGQKVNTLFLTPSILSNHAESLREILSNTKNRKWKLEVEGGSQSQTHYRWVGAFHLSMNVLNNQSESSWKKKLLVDLDFLVLMLSDMRCLRWKSEFLHLTQCPGWSWVQNVQLPGNSHMHAL